MSVYQRPPRPDELYHWGKGSVAGNHKYIAKIGNRYFYTTEELKAFKDGVSGAKKKVSDNFSKLRQHVYDAAGGAAKRKAQATAKRANQAKNSLAEKRSAYEKREDAYERVHENYFSGGKRGFGNRNNPAKQQAIDNERAKGDSNVTSSTDTHYLAVGRPVTYHKPEGDRDPNSRVRRTQRNNDRERNFKNERDNAERSYKAAEKVERIAQNEADKAKKAYDRTPVGIAENAGKKVNHAKNSIERGKKKVQDYLADRKRQAEESKRIGEEMKEAEKRGEVTTLSDGTKVRIGEVKVGAIETPKKKKKR